MAPPAPTRNFQQHQPITTALRQICESYPAGTCLRELLQNADDANATEIEYVLDTNTYNAEPLLYDGLREFQGPALLARNNRTFSDKDFASLASIGDSRKRQDLAATGKFGQGFNSCYHWTDGPWIYSREWLLLLDPHENWSIPTGQAGGPAWDVVSGKDSEELQNHLKTFSAMTSTFSKPLDGTIIRIPLRTKAQAERSKIVQKEVTVQDITNALSVLGREVREGGLLFLKHVRKMVVRIDDKVMWEVHLKEQCNSDQLSIRDELTTDFKTLFMQPVSTNSTEVISKSFVLDMIFKEGTKEITSSFSMHHLMSQSSGDHELDAWARSKKLFPWVAVGAPLKESAPEEPFKGRLFSILRLPIETSHPVHVHGLFSITPDRGRLSSSGQTPGHEDFEVKWNNFMFERCVAEAWASLLQSRNNSSWKEEEFHLWPRVEDSPTEIWTKLDDFLLRKILSNNLRVWNTTHRCVTASEGLFTSNNSESAATYIQSLEGVQVPAVSLGPSFLGKVQKIAGQIEKPIQQITPGTVRYYLRENLSAIRDNVSSLVLEYCLLDVIDGNPADHVRQAVYEDLKPLPAWPTLEGRLEDLAQLTLLLPRNTEELFLFEPCRPATTIDIRKLSKLVKNRAETDIASGFISSMRKRSIADLAIDWPNIYSLPDEHGSSPELSQPRLAEKDVLIEGAWRWIESRYQEENSFPSVLGELWLLPIKGGRIRRCLPEPGSRPMLVVKRSDQLCQILDLDGPQSQAHMEAAQILDYHAINAAAISFIREQAPGIANFSAASADDAASLIHWLAANVSLITQITESNRLALLDILRRLVAEKWGSHAKNVDRTTSDRVAGELRQLPLFIRRRANPPYKDWLACTCDLLDNAIPLILPEGLPAMCPIPGISFYAASERSSERYVLESFNLLQQMDTETLLMEHLLPFVFSQQSVDMNGVKDSLANYALGKSRDRGQSWIHKLNQIPLIPLKIQPGQPPAYDRLDMLVDPESRLAKLFFSDELVFPNQQFFDRHRTALKHCGLPSKVTPDVIFGRVLHFAQFHKTGELIEKVHKMVASSVDAMIFQHPNVISQIKTLEWLPVTLPSGQLVRSSSIQSRAIEERDLVDHVYGILDSKVSIDWKRILGWNIAIDKEVLLEQLDACLRLSCHWQIDRVLHYLYDNYGLSSIESRQCLRSVRQVYVEASRAILPGSDLDKFPLAPYLEPLDESFIDTHAQLINNLEINAKPSLNNLMEVQQAVSDADNGEIVKDEQLNIIRNVLEIASRSLDPEDLTALQIPDSNRRLTRLTDIVHGDAGATIKGVEVRYTHPALSTELVKRLGIESLRERAVRLQVAIEDEDEDEYVPREELTTVISDTLTRYPITATFSEFLANAEDCSATQISWILDDRRAFTYSSENLMTAELRALQGSALFCHNDSVFTEKDFEGYKDIGRGGKQDDTTSIGLFGRGSMTMYHFTDNPMILSGDTLVILDPQQRLLPKTRNYKHRKAGVKLSLDTFKHNYPDQLLPFDGLCSYDKEMNFYPGTLFRMPLNRPSAVEKSLDVLEVRRLLMEYYGLARDSLLFLRSVRSIDFRVRKQAFAQWSISADFSPNFAGEIFEQLRLRGQQHGAGQFEETWHIGLMDRERVPEDVAIPNVGKLKIIELGVAACVHSEVLKDETASNLMIPARKIYCKLPTTYESGLPVALSATFAMSSDRRTIFTEEPRESTSKWNHWLLETCLPDLYIEFLKYLAPNLGMKVFQFWPSTVAKANPVSQLVQAAFWNKITSPQYSQYPLYPVVEGAALPDDSRALKTRKSGARILHPVVSLESAEFDMLPSNVSDFLRPLVSSLCLQLVRPPMKLRVVISAKKSSRMTMIDSKYLCSLLRQEQNLAVVPTFLSRFEEAKLKSKALEVVLLETVPEYIEGREKDLHILEGCRLLPRLDGSLTILSVVDLNNQSSVDWAMLPSAEEMFVFGFAEISLVAARLFTDSSSNEFARLEHIARNPIIDLMKSSFNIRHIESHDIKPLLTQKLSPLAAVQDSLPNDEWFSRLWSYLQLKLSKAEGENQGVSESYTSCTTIFDLGNCPIYRWHDGDRWQYITPNEFEVGSFIIKPASKGEVALCEELKGLGLVDQAHVESALATAERSLEYKPSFERMLRALRQMELRSGIPVKKFLRQRLSESSIKVLQRIVLHHAKDKNNVDDLETFKLLPIWQTSTTQYLAAEDLVFCRHAPLVAWLACITRPTNFAEPVFVRTRETLLQNIGVSLTDAETVFEEYIEPNLPQTLIEAQESAFYSMIECLHSNSIRTKSRIVPNGNGSLRSPKALFDHDDPIFEAAFREPLENLKFFVKVGFRSLRNYWIAIGLRKRLDSEIYSSDDYLQCVKAMEARSSRQTIDNTFSTDVETVAGYLTYDKQCLRTWKQEHWNQISRAEIFTVQMGFPQDGIYRQARVQALAHRDAHCSMQQAGKHSLRRVLWSQLPFLSNPPADYIYSQVPECINPDPQVVYKHLLYLIETMQQIQSQDIVEFLKDVQACYSFFQDDVARAGHIVEADIRQAAIWLNLDTTELDTVTPEQMVTSVIAADRLCINATTEPYPYKNTRKFLTPYEKLLKALDVHAVVDREFDIRDVSEDTETPSDFLTNNYRRLRDQGYLLDVVFQAEGGSKPAHKVSMAAVSAYCKAQFSGPWGSILAQNGNNTILVDIKYDTLSRIVDFAYDGFVIWTPLPEEPTNDQIANRLDEILDLLQAADMWIMPHLKMITENHLRMPENFRVYVRIDNVEGVLEEALKARADELAEQCRVYREDNQKFVDLFRDGVADGGS